MSPGSGSKHETFLFRRPSRIVGEYFHAKEVRYQLNVQLKSGGYGNLILSRWNMVRYREFSLRYKNRKNRGVQIAVIETPEGELQLVHWHLGLVETERQWQANQLLADQEFQHGMHNPTIIIGDTNDWRNRLFETCFREWNIDQATRPISRFRTFPAWLPVGSLDKAFVRGSVNIKKAHVIKSPLTRKASDHLPIVLDFHLSSD